MGPWLQSLPGRGVFGQTAEARPLRVAADKKYLKYLETEGGASGKLYTSRLRNCSAERAGRSRRSYLNQEGERT